MALRQTIKDLTTSNKQANELTTELFDKHIAEYIPPSVSTGITWLAAGAMGAIDGALGPRRSLGPVPISAIVGVGLAVGGLLTSEPNAKEAMNAAARGIGAPVAHDLGFRATLGYFHPGLLSMIEEMDAALAAAAVSASKDADKAKKA